MEIVSKKKPSCRFDEIEKGQCFVIVTDIDAIYMRMQMQAVNKVCPLLRDDNGDHSKACIVFNPSEYTFAAVDLSTGRVYAFAPDSIVIPIEAKVEIQ